MSEVELFSAAAFLALIIFLGKVFLFMFCAKLLIKWWKGK